MNNRDKTLRPEESSLEISRAALDELSSQVTQLVADYYSEIRGLPVFPETYAGKTSEQIGTLLPIEGEALGELLNDCRSILNGSRHNGHPRFFGYVASPSTAPGVFADLIASAVNVNVTSWRSGPAATEIERTVIGWLAEMIGYANESQKAYGLLTSGGSMANFTALLIAHRTKAGARVAGEGLWNSHPMTIYASSEIHMSIPKAADMLGLGRQNVRLVECDDQFRMDVSKLRASIAADLENGLQPFCVVASAGTVNTGAVDPLAEIADVAASLVFGSTSMARMAHSLRSTNRNGRISPAWIGQTPFRSTRTSGFTFLSIPVVCCFAMKLGRAPLSVSMKLITSKSTSMMKMRPLLSGIMDRSSRVGFAR